MTTAYLALNLAVVLAYLLTLVFRRFAPRLGQGQRLRLAQLILLAAVVTALATPALPKGLLRPLRAWAPPSPALDAFITEGLDGDFGAAKKHAPSAVRVAAAARTAPVPASRPFPWGRAWLALGFLFAAIRFAGQARRLRRLLADCTPLRRLGRVELLVTEAIRIPFSARWLGRACVVLPLSLLESRRAIALATRHELQHHRQGDTLWVYVCEALKLFFYWNPAAYLYHAELAELQEFACDEALALRPHLSRREYGACLLRVAESAVFPTPSLALAAGMANPFFNRKSLLRRRIEMLSAYRPRPSNKALTLLASLAIALVLGGGGLAFATLVSGKSPEPAIDPAVQGIAEEALRAGIRYSRAESGYAIVEEVASGRVLAVAAIGSTTKPSVAQFLSEPTEPWSVMKPILAAVAVEEGKTKWNEEHDCENGSYPVDGKIYHDWKPFGKLTTAGMVIYSSDICAIKVMQRLKAQDLLRDLGRFGFGEGSSAVGYPQARPGHLPQPGQSEFVPLLVGGAEGLAVTPLEVVQAYAAFANGGKLLRPRPADAPEAPEVIGQVLSPANAEAIRGVLRRVVLEGTGHEAATADYTTGGKTGTGRKLVRARKQEIASFAGLAPITSPRLAIYVTILDPHNGESVGSRHAAPVFSRIAEAALKHYGVAPDLHPKSN